MSDMFQIVGECAYATVDTYAGRSKTLLLKGALIPADTPELEHLVESGLAAKVDANTGAGLNAEGGLGPAEADSTAHGSVVSSVPPDPDRQAADRERSEADARWAAAEAKLPAGQKPDGRSSDDVWRVYAVRQGMDRAEVEKASKADLQGALK